MVVAHSSPLYFTDELFGNTGDRRAEVVIDRVLRILIYYFCTACKDFGGIFIRGVYFPTRSNFLLFISF